MKTYKNKLTYNFPNNFNLYSILMHIILTLKIYIWYNFYNAIVSFTTFQQLSMGAVAWVTAGISHVK